MRLTRKVWLTQALSITQISLLESPRKSLSLSRLLKSIWQWMRAFLANVGTLQMTKCSNISKLYMKKTTAPERLSSDLKGWLLLRIRRGRIPLKFKTIPIVDHKKASFPLVTLSIRFRGKIQSKTIAKMEALLKRLKTANNLRAWSGLTTVHRIM